MASNNMLSDRVNKLQSKLVTLRKELEKLVVDLTPLKLPSVDNVLSEIELIKTELNKENSLLDDVKEIDPYINQIKNTFKEIIMPAISAATWKSTALSITIGIVVTVMVGLGTTWYAVSQTSRKATEEIKQVATDATKRIAEVRTVSASSFSWLDDVEASAAFGPPSQLDDLRKELGKDLPFGCRPPRTGKYEELSRKVTSTGSFTKEEQALLKAALFFCNRDYKKASIYLDYIHESTLVRDRDWLKALILAELEKWEEIQPILALISKSKGSWFAVDEQRIQETVRDMGTRYQEHQKRKIKVCVYDASAGIHREKRGEEGQKLCQTLEFLGWRECDARPLDYKRYSEYFGKLTRGLSTQMTLYTDKRIWSDLLADISLIRTFGETIRQNAEIDPASNQWKYMGKLLEDCQGDIAIIVGTEFGGVYEKMETLEEFKKHQKTRSRQ